MKCRALHARELPLEMLRLKRKRKTEAYRKKPILFFMYQFYAEN
jgi:hypothetical protein